MRFAFLIVGGEVLAVGEKMGPCVSHGGKGDELSRYPELRVWRLIASKKDGILEG